MYNAWVRVHGSSRGSSNHLQCSVAVFTVMFFVSILMVLMLLDCAVRAHKHCTDFTQPSLLFALSYCDFEKTCTKCAIISQEFVIFKCVREERVSCVLCGEERMRCGFLFLWLTLLSDALDINIIVHQWPTQKSHPSLHISIRPADLSECTVLSLTTGDRLVCSCSPVNKLYNIVFTGYEARGFKSKCAPCIFGLTRYYIFKTYYFRMCMRLLFLSVKFLVKPFVVWFCKKLFSIYNVSVCLFFSFESLYPIMHDKSVWFILVHKPITSLPAPFWLTRNNELWSLAVFK